MHVDDDDDDDDDDDACELETRSISCRKETVRLLRRPVLIKYYWEMIFSAEVYF